MYLDSAENFLISVNPKLESASAQLKLELVSLIEIIHFSTICVP